MRIIAKGEGKGETMGVVGSNEKKSTSKKEKEKKNWILTNKYMYTKRNKKG